MANCSQYQSLDHRERFTLIGQIVHLLQNDPESFVALSSMARSAEQYGKLDDVKFLPENTENPLSL